MLSRRSCDLFSHHHAAYQSLRLSIVFLAHVWNTYPSDALLNIFTLLALVASLNGVLVAVTFVAITNAALRLRVSGARRTQGPRGLIAVSGNVSQFVPRVDLFVICRQPQAPVEFIVARMHGWPSSFRFLLRL